MRQQPTQPPAPKLATRPIVARVLQAVPVPSSTRGKVTTAIIAAGVAALGAIAPGSPLDAVQTVALWLASLVGLR